MVWKLMSPLAKLVFHGLCAAAIIAGFCAVQARYLSDQGTDYNKWLDKTEIKACIKKTQKVDKLFGSLYDSPAEQYCICINRNGKTTTDQNQLWICRAQAEFVYQAFLQTEPMTPNPLDGNAKQQPWFIFGSPEVDGVRVLCSTLQWDKENSRLSVTSACGRADFDGKVFWTGNLQKHLKDHNRKLDKWSLNRFYFGSTKLAPLEFVAKIDLGAARSKTATATQESCTASAKLKTSKFHVAMDDSDEDYGNWIYKRMATEKVANMLGATTAAFADKQRDVVCKLLLAAAEATIRQLAADNIDLAKLASTRISNEDLFWA